MSGRIENLSLAELVGRSTSIVRVDGAGRIEAVLKGPLRAGEVVKFASHGAWRSQEWERIRRERGVMKIMFHPTYEGKGGPGKPAILFLGSARLDDAWVLAADGAVEDPAREPEIRALSAGREASEAPEDPAPAPADGPDG